MSETMMAPAFVEKFAQHVRAITLLADTLPDVEGASEVLASAAGLLIIEAAKRSSMNEALAVLMVAVREKIP